MRFLPTRNALASHRQLFLTLGVLCLVALAGCASSADTTADNSTDIDSSDLPAETTDSDPAEQSETGEQADASTDVDAIVLKSSDDSSKADETGDQSETSASLQAAHTETVSEANSITTRLVTELDTPKGSLAFNSTAAVDLSTNDVRQRTLYTGSTAGGLISTTFAEVDSYITPTEQYKRTTSDFTSEPSYNYTQTNGQAAAWNVTNFEQYLQADLINNADTNIDWTRDGSTTFDGETVARYVADDDKQFDGFRSNATSTIDGRTSDNGDQQSFSLGDNTTITITNQRGAMLVDSDGVVRQLTYQVNATDDDGKESSLTIQLSMTDIGETSAQQPAWTAEAEQGTN